MNKPAKENKIPPKPEKPKGPVTLGRTTFIDEILKKTKSQPSVGPRKFICRQPTSSLQATESPSEAFAEIKIVGIEQDSQEIENSLLISVQEGNSSNLCEGGGETGEIEEPKSPFEVIQTVSSPDK